MSNHTPGPWQNIKFNNLVFVVHCPGGYKETEPFKGHVIMSETTCPDSEANARLIAAAPDLLAALEGMLAGYDDSYTSDQPPNIAARAAIAKATNQPTP